MDSRHWRDCYWRVADSRESRGMCSPANRITRSWRDAKPDSKPVRLSRRVTLARCLSNAGPKRDAGFHERERRANG